MLKIPLLVSLGHHGGRRKVASSRPPFSTPLRSLGEPDPETPFLVPIEHAPPLFVRIREDKISLKIYPAPLSIQKDNHQLISKRQKAGGGDCFGRLIARWSSFMHVSVYLEAESPCQFPVFQTTHFGALVRLLFHELLGLQLRRLLRWSSIGAREGLYLLCSLLLEPWIKFCFES